MARRPRDSILETRCGSRCGVSWGCDGAGKMKDGGAGRAKARDNNDNAESRAQGSVPDSSLGPCVSRPSSPGEPHPVMRQRQREIERDRERERERERLRLPHKNQKPSSVHLNAPNHVGTAKTSLYTQLKPSQRLTPSPFPQYVPRDLSSILVSPWRALPRRHCHNVWKDSLPPVSQQLRPS